MQEPPALLSLIAAPHAVGDCELCGQPNQALAGTVVVHLQTGAAVRFPACDRCVRALRRIAAASGGVTRFALTGPAPAVVPPMTAEAVGEAVGYELLVQLRDPLEAPDGTRYLVAVYGGPRADGRWLGWLVFRPVAGTQATRLRRTDWETTQSDRAALLHWASVLGPEYVEGAFTRAQPHVTPGPIG